MQPKFLARLQRVYLPERIIMAIEFLMREKSSAYKSDKNERNDQRFFYAQLGDEYEKKEDACRKSQPSAKRLGKENGCEGKREPYAIIQKEFFVHAKVAITYARLYTFEKRVSENKNGKRHKIHGHVIGGSKEAVESSLNGHMDSKDIFD